MKSGKTLCTRLLALLLCAALVFDALPAVQAAEGVDVTAKFTDPVFRAFVYEAVNKQPGEPIYDTDVAQVKSLNLARYHTDPEVALRNLTGLEYFTGLETLDVSYCNLTALDVRALKHLKGLYCGINRLKTLDLRGLDELEAVNCSENLLTELLVSSTTLSHLSCNDNLLTALDLSGCPALTGLGCNDNHLESLDLSACPRLEFLSCSNNYMQSRTAVVGYAPEGTEKELFFAPQNDEKVVPRLDYSAREKICADYARACEDVPLAPEDVRIEKYYGCFDGLYVLNLRLSVPLLEVEQTVPIGGYVFHFPSYYSRRFLAYRDGEFFPVPEAFASGDLSKAGLRALFDRFYENAEFPFTDVREDAWYYGSVRDAFNCRFFNGVGDSRFNPGGTMTRAMLVTVLWRQNGEPEAENENIFSDVADHSWYTEAVNWAAKNKIVEGVGGGRFAPDSSVTRAQFVTILHRLNGKPEMVNPVDESRFSDFDTVSDWAVDALRWAVSCGILEGAKQADGSLRIDPGAPATRAQGAALLMRYIDSLPDHVKQPADPDPKPDPDPDPDPKPDPTPDPETGTADLMEGYHSSLTGEPAPLTDKAADAMADFTLNLFRAADDPKENTILSPLSALYALAMLANGAKGETKAQLERAFGLDLDSLNEALRTVNAGLPEKNGADVHLANSIWVRDGFPVRPRFLQDNADWLDAAAYQAPFDERTVEAMNDWINAQTEGLIPRMINGLTPETVLVLINALYFCGQWADPYCGAVAEPFYPARGGVQTAEMLRSTERTYLVDGQAKGFIKPFQSGKYAFAVLVPDEGVRLEDYVASLDGKGLRRLLQGDRGYRVRAAMPKFKSETFVNLEDPLAALGVRDAFDSGRADLTGIADNLFVSSAAQKAVIELDEKGVKAAAVTVVSVEATSVPTEPIVTVTADRPYLYMIIDRTTNLPLFIGANRRFDGQTGSNPIPDPKPVEPTPEPLRTVDLMEDYTCQAARDPGPVSEEAADAVADFTLNMLRAVDDHRGNTVLSPLSAVYALDMLANGAGGDTRAQLEQVLGLPVGELNEALRSVRANLPDLNSPVDVHLANSIWIRSGFEVGDQFLQDNADYLDAGAFETPFDARSLEDINEWISYHTKGMIPRMLDELSPDTLVALINALYFRGEWAEPYESAAPEPFYPAEGGAQTAQMLRSAERLYLHDARATGFVKPFKGTKYAFAVVVPKEGVSVDDYIAGLDGAALRELLRGEVYDAVRAAMPKFQAETFADLNEPLQAMGIRDAFDPARADLSGISEGLYVSQSLQKAVIDLDENGVSAAAATVITMEKGVSIPKKVAAVTADRPYLYMIIDRTTNLPLFIGVNRTME